MSTLTIYKAIDLVAYPVKLNTANDFDKVSEAARRQATVSKYFTIIPKTLK